MRTPDSSLQGSYFDLLKAKYPDLQPGAAVPRAELQAKPQPARRRARRPWIPLLVLLALVVGALSLGVAMRPESSALVAEFPAEPSGRELVAALFAQLAAEPEAVGLATAVGGTVPPPALSLPDLPPLGGASVIGSRRLGAEPQEANGGDVGSVAGLDELARLANEAVGLVAGETPEPRVATEVVEALATASFQPARKVIAPVPEYPESARRAGEEGAVVVEADIDPLGVVSGTRVVRGRSKALDRAALEALREWRFEPATRGGTPVASSYRVSFEFHLQPGIEGEAAEPSRVRPVET